MGHLGFKKMLAMVKCHFTWPLQDTADPVTAVSATTSQ